MAPEDVIRARAAWLQTALEGKAEPSSVADHLAPPVLEKFPPEQLLKMLRDAGQGRTPVGVDIGPGDHVFTVRLSAPEGDGTAGGNSDNGEAGTKRADQMPARAECHLDANGMITGLGLFADTHPDLAMTARRVDQLDPSLVTNVHELFDATYDQADHSYLDKSLATLGSVATAHRNGELVGFALGGRCRLDLPDPLGPTTALLAGLCCVSPDVRRQGVFRRLANLALLAGGPLNEDRHLGAGRMAHPTSMRVYKDVPSVVPKPGIAPTALQQKVGALVADAYGCRDFDAETFVCRGSGTPIGYPKLEQQVEPDEWKVFAPVDRSRGDALLAIIFNPDAPDGW